MRTLAIQITSGGAGDSFEQVIAWLEAAGLSLANPFNNRVTYFGNAEAGQCETTAEEIGDKLRNKVAGNAQMWLEAGEDVFMSWTAAEMRIYLDGKNAEQKRKVLCAVAGGFAEFCAGHGAGWKICIADEELI